MELQKYLEAIEKRLFRSFDIKRDYSAGGMQYDLFAEYHLRNEKYMLSKKAVVYAFENNEYCLVKHFLGLDLSGLRQHMDGVVSAVEGIIKPDSEHMSSIVTVVFVMDDASANGIDAVIQAVEKYSYHKSFALGFKGWVDIRLLLVSLKEGVIAANKKGRQVSKVYGL